MPTPDDAAPAPSLVLGPDDIARALSAALFETDQQDDDLPRLDGYRLVRQLGRGGGGSVYLGFHHGSDRPVAIKLLARRIHGDPGGRRAWRELDLLANLRLPCLTRLLDYGVQGARLFIVTEYVEGQPLDEHCAPLGRRERVETLARVADAVQSLHEHGVIHRDLKPSNILVGAAGHPTIIDLGIATLLTHDPAETFTTEGSPLGSPAFMAPEQARGDREQISTRTDVYGLGATACLVLTGQTPFDCSGSIHQTLRTISTDEPRPARALAPALPRPLTDVLDKALARDPAHRYGSAGEFAADLRRWLDGDSVLAGRRTPWRRAWQWLGRHPVVTTVAAACLVISCVLATMAVVVWWAGLTPSLIRVGTNKDGDHWAEVRSAAGMTLRRWEGPAGSIRAALRLQPDPALGGATLFIVAAPDPDRGDPGGSELCAYAASNLRQPAWTIGHETTDFPMPPLDGFTAPLVFSCESASITDVFPESPGDEIVAVFRHTSWSPSLIEVLDARGRPLYQAWHNGWISGVAWLSGPRLLVLSGVNSEATWLGRVQPPPRRSFPSIVCAIRPVFGGHAGWISTPSAPGGTVPDWYKCVLPPEAMDRLFTAPGGNLGVAAVSPDTFRVQLDLIGLFLDAQGREVRPRHIDARYNLAGDRPDANTSFWLGELPPIDPARAAVARPANN